MAAEIDDKENSTFVGPNAPEVDNSSSSQYENTLKDPEVLEKNRSGEEQENDTGREEVESVRPLQETSVNPGDPEADDRREYVSENEKPVPAESTPLDGVHEQDVEEANPIIKPPGESGSTPEGKSDTQVEGEQLLTSNSECLESEERGEVEKERDDVEDVEPSQTVQQPAANDQTKEEPVLEDGSPSEEGKGLGHAESSTEEDKEKEVTGSLGNPGGDQKQKVADSDSTVPVPEGLSKEEPLQTVEGAQAQVNSGRRDSSEPKDGSTLEDESLTEDSSDRPLEVAPEPPKVTTYSVFYLGSTVIFSPEMPTKEQRYAQTEEVIDLIKQPEGEPQPKFPVSLEVSIEGIRIVHSETKEELMSHPLVTIGFVADCKDLLVILMRKVPTGTPTSKTPPTKIGEPKLVKMRCHVLQSNESGRISGHIGQLFHEAYKIYLRMNNLSEQPTAIDDYDKILRAQEQVSGEIECLRDAEKTKEITFPKKKNEPLGLMLIESGFGSPIPTCVIAAISKTGAAHRSGLLNVGDHIISLNGVNFVGLTVKSCTWHVKKARMVDKVKMVVAHCPPVVELKLYRPDVKYNLGFCVKNGLVDSLYRGTIADRSGIRVGHQIIELNGCSIVDVPHENVVRMLQTTIGHIHIKSMPYQIYRLMTGQAIPEYS